MKKEVVYRGETATIPMFLYNLYGRPYSLEGYDSIVVTLPNKFGGQSSFISAPSSGGTASGVWDSIPFYAVQSGVTGNEIELVFDGVQTVQAVVAGHNTVYPNNKVEWDVSDLALAYASINLAGGTNATPAFGSYATYQNIPYFSVIKGAITNAITLTYTGTNSVEQALATWNTANPANQAYQDGANLILPAGIAIFSGGTNSIAGSYASTVYQNMQFQSVNKSTAANSISLVFNGTDTTATVVTNWNTANSTNQCIFLGDFLILASPAVITLAGGLNSVQGVKASTTYDNIYFQYDTEGTAGNVSLTFNGTTDTINSVIGTQTITYNADSVVLPAGSVTLTGGTNATTNQAARATQTYTTFVADNIGTIGNSIELSFNGVNETVAQVTIAWNTANPTNTVSYNSSGSIILPYSTIKLQGGSSVSSAATASGTYQGVVFSCTVAGSAGNVTLVFDGVKTIKEVLDTFNAANPNTPIVYNANTYIPIAGTASLTGGVNAFSGTKAFAVYQDVFFEATNVGTAGNSISLIFNGDNLGTVVNTWNMANTSNTCTYNSGGVILAAGTANLSGGSASYAGTKATSTYMGIPFSATLVGTQGNNIQLIFTGKNTVNATVSSWNLANPSNTCYDAINQSVPPAFVLRFTGGADAQAAVKASVVYQGIKFLADIAGYNGNYINLVFNGTYTIEKVLHDWNLMNPTNPCSTDVQNQVLKQGRLKLSGGTAATLQVIVLDKTLGIIECSLDEQQTADLLLGDGQNIGITVNFINGLKQKGLGWNKIDVTEL